MNALESLIRSLAKLPGIGRKSATRMAYFLLKTDENYVHQLSSQLIDLKQNIKCCSICGMYTEVDPCEYCTDSSRDLKSICIVETSQDVSMIESTGEFKGKYHVLNGLISPINGIGPSALGIDRLVRRIQEEDIKEIIIATNPTTEGDTTALYIHQIIQNKDVTVSRLASGMPVGGDLGYIDKLTLMRSFKGRQPIV